MSSDARPLSASPQLGERPAPGNAIEIATKEKASLILVGLFQNFVSVLQEGSSGHEMLERITPGILAQRISEKAFMTPETANEIVQSLIGRLNIILRDSGASGDDELIAVLQTDAKWLRPSVEERRQASREMRLNIKQCNNKLPAAEALTIPHIKQVNKDVEYLLFEKAINFIEYKNICEAMAREANQCCHQLPDNIGLWRHLLLTYLPEDHDLRPITTPLASSEQPPVDVSKEHSNLAQAATCLVPSTGSTDLASSPSKPLDQDMDVDSAVVTNASSTQGFGDTAISGMSVTPPMVAPSAHDGMDVDESIDETQKPSQVSTTRGTATNGSHSAVSLPQPAASQFDPSYGAGSTNEPTNNTLNLPPSPNVSTSGSRTSAQSEPVPTVAQPWQPTLSANRFPVTGRGAVHSGRRREQIQRATRDRILENGGVRVARRHRLRAARENNPSRNNATESKLAADVQALNSKLEYLEKMMSQRQRRDLKRLRDAKKQSRRSHTRLREAANLVGTRLYRLERSQQEAYAYNEDLKRRELEVTARENKVIAQQEEIAAQQKEMAAHRKKMAAHRTELIVERTEMISRRKGIAIQQKEMIAREKEMVTLQKDMVARQKDMVTRQKDMAARQKKLDEREQLLSTRLQAIAEQAMVFAHTPDSVFQQETTTASANNPSQPRVQEYTMAISDTLKASHSSARSAPSAAQAATVPAILQHPQTPRGFLPLKTEVQ